MKLIKHPYFILALFMFMMNLGIFAQKEYKETGSAQVRMEDDMTTREAYKEAERLAMINAIENAFGTYVQQTTNMTLEDGRVAYTMIGSTKVKGDWVETLDLNFKEDVRLEPGTYGKQNVKYVTCNIKGKVREAVPKAAIDFEIMNCLKVECRTTDFINGEQLYLYFKTPVDGYISVYAAEGDTTYRILPYQGMTANEYQGGVPVNGDQDYLFFSPEANTIKYAKVDEISMVTSKKSEQVIIYIVFAEDKFRKPILKSDKKTKDKHLPKSLQSDDFQDWLTSNRAVLTSFQDREVIVSIKAD